MASETKTAEYLRKLEAEGRLDQATTKFREEYELESGQCLHWQSVFIALTATVKAMGWNEAAPEATEFKLTSQEKFLLEWLSKEHSSSLGECEGQSLDALVDLGLAEIGPTPEGKHPHYRRVSLTDKGQEAVSQSFQASV